MGFHIDYGKMRSYYLDMEMWLGSHLTVLGDLTQRWTELMEGDGMKGEGADAIRAYISEFHLSMTSGLNVLLLQLYSKLLLYTDDYYTNIDDAPDALLIEDALNTYITTLRNRLNLIDYFDGEAGTVVGSVSDICSIAKPGKVSLDELGKGLIRRTQQLIEDVTVLEESHAGDLDEPQELLDSLKGIMASFCWQMDKRMSGYEPGMIVQSAEFGRMAEAFALNVNDYTEQVEQMEAAQEHEQYRKEVEFRIDNGIMKILYGVGCVVTGVCAILATGGAATPLVVMSWVGATGATVYGLSEIGEGVQSYELGQMGDVDTETFNFGRDVLCGGNEELYHMLGKASVALCDIASFGADISDALSFFRKGGSGGGFIDDITEHLTKGMDGVDDVVDGAVDAVPNMSAVDEIAGLADDVVEEGSNTSRGMLSDYLGVPEENADGFFYSIKNSQGGNVYVSVDEITPEHFADIVSESEGKVNILSGVHGDEMGNIMSDRELYFYDITHFEGEKINVLDFSTMDIDDISKVVNSSDTTICAWCFSERNPAIRLVLQR